jgi:hypothetical protein
MAGEAFTVARPQTTPPCNNGRRAQRPRLEETPEDRLPNSRHGIVALDHDEVKKLPGNSAGTDPP